MAMKKPNATKKGEAEKSGKAMVVVKSATPNKMAKKMVEKKKGK